MINNVNINGPINIIRIENKKLGKIVYLLGDYHEEELQQAKCTDIEAIDIDKLIYKFFSEEKII